MICEETGKIVYNSKHEAEVVIRKKKDKQKRRRRFNTGKEIKEASAYKCQFCGMWHLAGKKKKKFKSVNNS